MQSNLAAVLCLAAILPPSSNLPLHARFERSCHEAGNLCTGLAPFTSRVTAASSGHSPVSLRRRRPGRPRRPIILRVPSAGGLTPSLPPPLPRAAPPRAASAFPMLSSSALCGRPDTAAAFGDAASISFGDLRPLASTICARLAATAFAVAASSSLGVCAAAVAGAASSGLGVASALISGRAARILFSM